MRSNFAQQTIAMLCVALTITTAAVADEQRARFRPDDPVTADRDDALDAGAVRPDRLGSYADFILNTFRSPADARQVAALNVNTLGEVPDSSWFTNRLGARPMTIAEIVRGPNQHERLDIGDWIIVQGKNTGRQAGFRAVSASDPSGRLYQIEFDPHDHPEMATGAEIIGTAIYHALGYNVVEMYLADIDPARITISPSATIEVGGRKRPFTRRDLEAVLRRSARQANGVYRATVSPFAEGRYVGPFRYYGTRPDDPNDIYPHEHRRELRANRVFAAWLNHDDSRAVNSLDMLIGAPGRQYVKHYMFDFGSILGSGTNDPDHPWVGHEYVVEPRPAVLTLATLGLWRRPFISVDTSTRGAAGSFTADRFVPEQWKPHYPNPAFANMRADDAFWAAQRVAALSPEAVAAIVETARFSDPRVTDYITGVLLKRRQAVLQAWLVAQNPITDVRIEGDQLRFRNAAEQVDVAVPGATYELSWFTYDNTRDARSYTDIVLAQDAESAVPKSSVGDAQYVGVEIRTVHPSYRHWQTPVTGYFRRTAGGWATIAIDRETRAAALQANR
jgi:hypothetical protein